MKFVACQSLVKYERMFFITLVTQCTYWGTALQRTATQWNELYTIIYQAHLRELSIILVKERKPSSYKMWYHMYHTPENAEALKQEWKTV